MKLCLMSVVVTLLVIACICAPSLVRAQARVAFRDPAAVQLAIDNRPLVFMAILCDMFPQEVIEAIEDAVCPAQTIEEQRVSLRELLLRLDRAGFDAEGPAMTEANEHLAALPEPAPESIR